MYYKLEEIMNEEFLYINEVGKRKNKQKAKKVFPVINRTDIMRGILSPKLDKFQKAKLSNMYAEITYMEKIDLKYIREITVSSQDDFEIYTLLKKLNKKKYN